ncbi:multinuclear nonheme iron-dependent oxidase [Flavitalea flava]
MHDVNRNADIRVGIAYNHYLDALQDSQMEGFDYIEVPFELLNFDGKLIHTLNKKPLVLHCASLSLAGYTAADERTKTQLAHYIKETRTPWLGEHIAFITGDRIDDNYYEAYAEGEPYNIGYTVSSVMNKESVDNIINNARINEEYFQIPIIMENSPLYFSLPGSTMNQTEFLSTICRNSETELLLDLTHWYISSKNFSFDAKKELTRLPLDRVVEVHISGVSFDGESHWDNHAEKAPAIIFELLEILLKHTRPQAITLEYNWHSNFPLSVLQEELTKVKTTISKY